jgi:ubiquinone/menaquinone biosynthesis C-methylase UbiE
MNTQPVNSTWFEHLRTVCLRNKYAWLSILKGSINSIADYGCWSSEPYALLWTLDASEIIVVEKKLANLDAAKEDLEILMSSVPASMAGRDIKFFVADMTSMVKGLFTNSVDLAFCQDVLYQIYEDNQDLSDVQNTLNEMTRVVKPGGWVIAVEPEIGTKIEPPCRVSDPIDISPLFQKMALIKTILEGAPEWSYCYKKPQIDDASVGHNQ